MSIGCEEKTVEEQKNRNRFFVSSRINRFGERLKIAMDAKGINSNVKMGEMCGMSDTVIRNYLIGKTYPTLDRLSILAYVVERSPAWLLCGSESEQQEKHVDDKVGNGDLSDEKIDPQTSLVLAMLNNSQKDLLSKAILNHGVSGIISALNGVAAIDEFMLIPECDRERVLRLYKQLKERDSESDHGSAEGNPIEEQRAG